MGTWGTEHCALAEADNGAPLRRWGFAWPDGWGMQHSVLCNNAIGEDQNQMVLQKSMQHINMFRFERPEIQGKNTKTLRNLLVSSLDSKYSKKNRTAMLNTVSFNSADILAVTLPTGTEGIGHRNHSLFTTWASHLRNHQPPCLLMIAQRQRTRNWVWN